MSEPTVTGIHHITAIAGDPQRNLDFYTEVLGLRLVKLTVNFDDPGTYHFYFGDAEGRPGSILTFFPWAGVPRGTVGNGQVTATSFAVPWGSLDYWRERLRNAGIPVEDTGERFGETVFRFADPDGLPLELISTAGAGRAPSGAITGFHSATLSEEGYENTAALLEGVMGLRPVGQEGSRYRYEMGTGGPSKIVDVVCSPEARRGRLGAGTVHHIAWRTPDDAQQLAWRKRLVEDGYNVSPVMDRTYFHSIYYREPGGILFEIATDPPGFTLDEPLDHLGERLMLPPQFEAHRALIEKQVPKLTLPHAKTRR
jgi:catechol 2,3-dioxygenase-like lactoylglutathione lyase family enzyme